MKETYVVGDIIETIGGNNLSYAKDNIENIGSQLIQRSFFKWQWSIIEDEAKTYYH